MLNVLEVAFSFGNREKTRMNVLTTLTVSVDSSFLKSSHFTGPILTFSTAMLILSYFFLDRMAKLVINWYDDMLSCEACTTFLTLVLVLISSFAATPLEIE